MKNKMISIQNSVASRFPKMNPEMCVTGCPLSILNGL